MSAVRSAICRCLYRSGLDVLVLTAAMSWAYAALIRDVPYVPWEYPGAVAACAWALAVRVRGMSPHPATLLLLLPGALLLTLFTAAAFLPYLTPATWPLIFFVFARHSARRQRYILHAAAALAIPAPAAFLDFNFSFLSMFSGCEWWPLVFILLLELNERLLSLLVGEKS